MRGGLLLEKLSGSGSTRLTNVLKTGFVSVPTLVLRIRRIRDSHLLRSDVRARHDKMVGLVETMQTIADG